VNENTGRIQGHKPYFSMKRITFFLLFLLSCQPADANVYFGSLTAGNDVTIKEAKNTEKTASKSMKGTAELSLSVQNEYVQVGYAVNEARKSEKNLAKAKQSYTRYRRELGKQRGKLIKLKADLANGRIGIGQFWGHIWSVPRCKEKV